MDRLEQKVRDWLSASVFVVDTTDILSLTWRELAEDSDEPVFLIGHPDPIERDFTLELNDGSVYVLYIQPDEIMVCQFADSEKTTLVDFWTSKKSTGWKRTIGGK